MTYPSHSDMLAMAERLKRISVIYDTEGRLKPESERDRQIAALTASQAADLFTRFAPLSVPAEPVAWLHTMTYETGEQSRQVTLAPAHEWGTPGKDYSAEFTITSQPLYAAAPDIRSEDRDAPGTASTSTTALAQAGPAIRTEGTKEEEA